MSGDKCFQFPVLMIGPHLIDEFRTIDQCTTIITVIEYKNVNAVIVDCMKMIVYKCVADWFQFHCTSKSNMNCKNVK